MVFDKLFGRSKKKAEPDISFGRYSDNNKTVAKVNRWTDADNLFKKQEFHNSIEALFDYLRDDARNNVQLKRNGPAGEFSLYQGSKIVRGEFDEHQLRAEITLARMPQPSVPVMRRLLEMNFNLYYSRYALDQERLCMRFDSDIRTANPNKLYYGLKELAIKADKLDDLLVQEFSVLQMADSDHIIDIPQAEKEVKFTFMQQWIREVLDYVAGLDADKFSGGIAYLLLTLAFRIDYLLCPEGKLMNELEKIVDLYFRKDEKQTMERNQAMLDGFSKLLDKPKEDVFASLFRSNHTFAIVAPQNHKAVADAINGATQNMPWYRDNAHSYIASKVLEYGFSFSQYSYSLPKPLSELYNLFMQVNYDNYFTALGFNGGYYNEKENKFDTERIYSRIDDIVAEWKPKYPKLDFKTGTLKFDTLVNFNHSFTAEICNLNFDS